MSDISYILGLDLGQASDYSALCVVERSPGPAAEPARKPRWSFAVRHLHRWRLGTPYTQVAADLKELGARPPLPGRRLAFDATGVGRPVYDLFRQERLPLKLVPILITSGAHEGESKGMRTVPKLNLVAVMQTLVQSKRFHVAPGLPDAAVLARELKTFRVKVSAATGNETFESWRERDHDDLVLAVSLACWLGSRPASGGWLAGGEPRGPSSPPGMDCYGGFGGGFDGW